ncbi:hypothetical protein Glove_174g41 [Diversispora epigaea]|uniref:SCP domain-containing protein n=1 Tax=Diversispora epigaea TaxID=1348612 RepID=A0A397IX97_9GLOM|nr:hypothetical protein Glove_174g41 [Diversispora epigaea]
MKLFNNTFFTKFIVILICISGFMEMGMMIIGADAFNPNIALKLINKERSKCGLRPLTLNGSLSKAAQFQADYCAKVHKLTHSNPAGPIGARLLKFKYAWSTAGENLASGFSSNAESKVVQAWMHSAGHRANILGKGFKNVGFGFCKDVWCADFGALLK